MNVFINIPLHHLMAQSLALLSYCKNLPFIEKIEIDSDEKQIEKCTVEETSQGDRSDELEIDMVDICLPMNIKILPYVTI